MTRERVRLIPGEIRRVDFGDGEKGLQGGVRPAIIIQNEKGCEFSPRVWVIPMTSKTDKRRDLMTHVHVPRTKENGLSVDSVALVEQAQFVPIENIGKRLGDLEAIAKAKCAIAMMRNFGGIFSEN